MHTNLHLHYGSEKLMVLDQWQLTALFRQLDKYANLNFDHAQWQKLLWKKTAYE